MEDRQERTLAQSEKSASKAEKELEWAKELQESPNIPDRRRGRLLAKEAKRRRSKAMRRFARAECEYFPDE